MMETEAASGAAGKTLYCVRHGESAFNEWRSKSLKDFSWMWVRDPMILDAPLSAKGRKQADELNAEVQANGLGKKVQVIVTSPLTRALETALRGFAGVDTPIVVDPVCREVLDTACDIGRQPQALQESFPNVDFSALPSDWWLDPHRSIQSPSAPPSSLGVPTTHKEVLPLRESDAQVEVRIREFVRHLAARPEEHIAVVGHSSFFKRMLGMSRKLRNCELYEVRFADVAAQWEC